MAALVCSLAGDVLLMLPREQFVAGLSAFLVAHVCYLAGFWTDGPALAASIPAAWWSPRRSGCCPADPARGPAPDPSLMAPVAAYMTVIGAMVATALAVGNPLAAAGAVLFAVSDSMIAWDRFVAASRVRACGSWSRTTWARPGSSCRCCAEPAAGSPLGYVLRSPGQVPIRSA